MLPPKAFCLIRQKADLDVRYVEQASDTRRHDRHGRFRHGPLLSELSRHYPFDRIKLVGSFIPDLPDKTNSRAIVRAIAELANSLGMGTTRKGSKRKSSLTT
jgi:hypothetical protein